MRAEQRCDSLFTVKQVRPPLPRPPLDGPRRRRSGQRLKPELATTTSPSFCQTSQASPTLEPWLCVCRWLV